MDNERGDRTDVVEMSEVEREESEVEWGWRSEAYRKEWSQKWQMDSQCK